MQSADILAYSLKIIPRSIGNLQRYIQHKRVASNEKRNHCNFQAKLVNCNNV